MNVNYEYKTAPVSIQRGSRQLVNLPHVHPEIEIVYVLKGHTVAYADQNVCDLYEGDVYISFPNQIHYYASDKDSFFYVLIVTPSLFFGKKELLFSNLPEYNAFTPQESDGVAKLIESIVRLPEDGDISEYTGYFNLLISRILNRLSLKPALSSEHSTMQTILEFCSKNFAEDLSLDYLSEHLHLSRCHISRLFNKKLDLGFGDYVNKLRVREACYLLRDSDLKIADISEEVGFGSIRTFNRAFKEIHGKTPAEYREEFK